MKRNKLTLLVTIGIAIIVSLIPIIELWQTKMVYSGADLQFHINRIHELVSQIKSGNLTLISLSSFNSVGSGVQYFYPNLTLIPAIMPFLIIKSNVTAYYVSLFIYGLIAFTTAKYAFSKILKDNQLSTLGSIIFSLSAYHVFSIIGVSAFGEFISIAWIPLILLGYYRVMKHEGWRTLWISMVLIGYTHLLSLMLAIVILIIITLARLIFNYKQVIDELLDYCKASIGFIISFLAFLGPFLLLTKQNSLLTPNAVLHYQWAQTFAGYYVSSVRLLSARTLGFVFIILLVGMFFSWGKLTKRTRLVFWGGFAILFVASSDFPWFELVKTPIANLQFPYRFVPFAVILLTLSATMAIKDWTGKKESQLLKRYIVVCLSLITITTTLISVHMYKKNMDATYRVETNIKGRLNYKPFAAYCVNDKMFDKSFNNHFITYGAFDYWTQVAAKNKGTITAHKILGANRKVVASKMQTSGSNITYRVGHNSTSQYLDLPFIKYQGITYQVKVNNRSVVPTMSKRGTLLVYAHKGANNIVVTPKISLKVIAFWLISLVGTIVVFGFRFKKAPLKH